MLLKVGFNQGFASLTGRILEYYEDFARAFFGWAEPCLDAILRYTLGWTALRFQLYPHWKHIFLIMWIYFGSDVMTHWKFGSALGGSAGAARKRLAISLAFCSGLVALAISIAAGVVPLYDAKSNTLMFAIVVAGFVSYEWAVNALATTFIRDQNETWWAAFRGHVRFPLQVAAVGAIMVLLGNQIAKVQVLKTLPAPSIALLAISVVLLALYRVAVGLAWTRQHRDLRREFSEVFQLSVSGPLGMRMLKLTAGVVLFLLTNAGLKFVGL
jgi:hypothetical protein